MTVLPAGLFTTGIVLTGIQRFLLMLPLCLSIAIIYDAFLHSSFFSSAVSRTFFI